MTSESALIDELEDNDDIEIAVAGLVSSYEREMERMESSGITEDSIEEDDMEDDDDDDDNDNDEDDLTISVPVAIPDDIPRWKRNAFRAFMVCLTAMFSMFLKNYFFYVSAFCGSLGSVLLAYILPCYFHIQLCPNEMSKPVLAKNVAIIGFGIAAGVAGLYSVINTLAFS